MAHNRWGEEARGDFGQRQRLLSAFQNESGHHLSGRFRGIILSIIADAQLPEALPLLVEQLQAPDPWLRYWAVKGLELLDTLESRKALRESRYLK
jgi:HEAT repeat protein